MVDGLAPVVHILADPLRAAEATADRLLALAETALRERGRFVLAVSGGRTPEPLYALLGRRRSGSPNWHLFLCDERLVPPEDPRSNLGLVRRLWLGPARFPEASVHAVETGLPADEAAERYNAALRAFFGVGPGPTFDLLLLGIGPDGHTASLFPGSPSLAERDRWAVAEKAPALDPAVARVTLTLPALSRARTALFLVSGADKQSSVARILGGGEPGPSSLLPAARISCAGPVEWFLDRRAAGGLSPQ
jgi:6-phosphogluconolactonase